jgi:hypothetical protein
VLGWAIAYVALGLAAAAVVRTRREPTIVRGDWVFLVTALYILAAAIVTAGRGGRFSLGVLATVVLVLLAGWLVQARWWVVGAAAPAVAATVEECAARLCAPVTSTPGTCTVSVPGGALRLRISPVTATSTMIVFLASTRHRKADLFRRLVTKQYRSVMPTIHLGERSA